MKTVHKITLLGYQYSTLALQGKSEEDKVSQTYIVIKFIHADIMTNCVNETIY